MSWKYKEGTISSIEEFPEGTQGFVYQVIHNPSGKKYIGKKTLYFSRKKPLTKKEKLEWNKPGKIPKSKTVISESDWKNYYGSNKFILEEIKKGNHSDFSRTILDFGKTKKNLTYLELKHQILNNVLEDSTYLNDNILGKFFTKDI